MKTFLSETMIPSSIPKEYFLADVAICSYFSSDARFGLKQNTIKTHDKMQEPIIEKVKYIQKLINHIDYAYISLIEAVI
jgi:ABC-type Zn uptake system ZnuABC Zn-binding protein ZnuA